MPRRALQDVAIAALLAIGAVLFWYLRIIVPADRLGVGGGDLYTQVYPMAYRTFDWLRHGYLPLWNPYQYCGMPLMATVLYGPFYPLNIFFLLIPRTEIAIECTVVLHIFAAGLFMYLYARSIGLGRGAALVAAATFMFSGFLASQALWFTPAISAAAWLPLAWLAIERIAGDGRARWAVLLGVAVAMPILAGWLQTWLYSMYGIAAYSAARVLVATSRPNERQRLARTVVLLAVGVVLGACFAAVQVLPTMELQQLGPRRPGGLSLAQTLIYGATPPAKLLAETVNSDTGAPRFSYLGILTLLLAPLAFFKNKDRWRPLFLWCLLSVSAAIALTLYTPVFEVYRKLPVGGWFRVPYRILYLYVIAGSVLCGIGFDAIASLKHDEPRGKTWSMLVLALAIPAVWRWSGFAPPRSLIYFGVSGVGVSAALVCGPVVRRALLPALGVFLAVDLFLASENNAQHPYHNTAVIDADHEAFDYISAHQELGRTYINSGNPFFDYAAMSKQGTLRGIYSITDYEPLSLDRYGRFYPLLEGPNAIDYNVQTFMGRLILDPTPERMKLFEMMGIRFAAVGRFAIPLRQGLEKAGWQLVLTPQKGNLVVYENPTPFPRAFVATNVAFKADGDEALAALSDASFDPRKITILESDTRPAVPPSGAADEGISSARVTYYAPMRVTIDTDVSAPGYLVLTDTFYPGWRAAIDGKDTQIYVADYLFRGVAVPAGKHTVTFRYVPLRFAIGALLSVSAVCVVALAAVVIGARAGRAALPASSVYAGLAPQTRR
ncbi:MAG: YfhO family protein [Deltaproteobacteria bacterium]|nr:YfhO family protein [Deltaproteobacteria bacterium]